VAPEVIRGQGYSYSCDWWSLGVIMFECLYGYVVFAHSRWHRRSDVTSVPGVQISSVRQQFCKKIFALNLALTLTSVYQRHVTRQKILNWKQSLRFPSLPRVSHEAVDLMQQLLCEPEDRLGSQTSTSVSRPNSMIVQARRSALITTSGATRSVDGAELIKASRACGIPSEPSF
jgi:protein-serine/threonine kinase